MSLQDIVVMIHNGEYSRAIASLEHEVGDRRVPPVQRVEYCRWLAECNGRLGDHQESGQWYLEAVRVILSERRGSPREDAIKLCDKALEAFEKGGDAADVLVAARVKQHLVGLTR
ncbi:MAG TPA: hypothetical protein VJR06_00600 [Nitrososphaerales archaeon]|nr:hypothetical protein [Nitrososphaerales archaeon]